MKKQLSLQESLDRIKLISSKTGSANLMNDGNGPNADTSNHIDNSVVVTLHERVNRMKVMLNLSTVYLVETELHLTEDEKVRNLNYNKRDATVNNLVTKIGATKELAEWAYDLSDKYCVWILNTIKKDFGIDYLNGNQQFGATNRRRYASIIRDLFQVRNKPITDIKTLSFNQASDNLDKIGYINDWATNPDVPTPDLTTMSWEAATAASTAWHESLKSGGDGKIKNEQGTIIHKFPDGYYWINTHKYHDADEAQAAGHCGTATKEDMVLVSLRNNKEVFLTFDYQEQTKEVIQFKGKANAKPIAKYHPYIVWLLSQKGLVDELNTEKGYLPKTNFQLTDLTDDEIKQVLNANPDLASDDTIKFLSPDTKIKYFNKVFKEFGRLTEKQFLLAPDDMKLEDCNKMITRLGGLKDYQFAWAPDNMKLDDCNKRIYLKDYQFAWAPDDMKLADCKRMIEKFGYLKIYQFAWASDDMKLADCSSVIERGGYLNDYQFAWAPTDMKLEDCKRMIEKLGYLLKHQFAWAPTEMKLADCNRMIEKLGYLLEHQFAWAPADMKLADCNRQIEENGRYLNEYQQEWYEQYKLEHNG